MSASADPKLVLFVAALCVPAFGCSKKAAESQAPESQQDMAGERDAQDPLAELDALEGRMRALGLATATANANANESPDDVGAGADGEDATLAGPEPAAVEATEPASTAEVNMSPSEETPSRCGDLCDLSESICMLEVRICSLSESHGADPIYVDACERAVDDCSTAGQACDACG